MRTKEEIAQSIWEQAVQEAVCTGTLGRAVQEIFREFVPGRETGTDGTRIYYHADSLFSLYEEKGQRGVNRLLFHMLFHVLYLNLAEEKDKDSRLRHLAWDISAEYTIDCMELVSLTGRMSQEAEDICRSLWQGKDYLSQEELRRRISEMELSCETIQRWERLFHADSHKFWKKPGEKELQRILKSAGLVHAGVQGQGKAGIGRRGSLPGEKKEWYQVQEQRKRDFRRFLRRYFVEREELQTDKESFDYIPYLYGLKRYGNLPLIEHLEYTEARKTEELVIAIDTSSSCRRAQVQRFLEETWSILSGQENFFRKINIHVIQCDCYIQEDAVLTCEKEWKDYLKNIRIQGRGGTDFRPVFRYLDQLIKEGEFQNLKGLLYFTDGDGIYPLEEPSYKTTFLLTKEPPREANVPAWAELMYLPQKEQDAEEKEQMIQE